MDGISTVIPSDLLRVGDSLYLHAIVNHGFGTVIWTEIWRSDDSGVSWTHLGEEAKFPADLHDGYAQCWSWDFDPHDGWVYVVATGFQRDKGIILMRVRPDQIGRRSQPETRNGVVIVAAKADGKKIFGLATMNIRFS